MTMMTRKTLSRRISFRGAKGGGERNGGGGNRWNEKNGDISRRANFLARLPADNNSSGSGVAAWGWNFISIPPAASTRGGTRFRSLLFAGVV